MSLNSKGIKGVAQGLLSDITSAADASRAEHVFVGRYLTKSYNHTEIGTNVNLAESPVYAAKYAGRVLRARITPAVNVAINTSNYVYLALSRSVGGAASTLVASLNTAVTALTKNVPASFTLNVNGVAFGADDVLTLTATKTIADGSATVSMTAATSQCEFGVDLEEGY